MQNKSSQICYLCPSCNSNMGYNKKMKPECSNCKEKINSRKNVLSFERDDGFYWGEISEIEMEKVISISGEKGWKTAVDLVIKIEYPHLLDMILSEDRVDWIRFIEGKDLIALDIGSGWGQTSLILANREKCKQVISLEKILKRAAFQKIRANQEGADNLDIIHGDIFNIKFKPNFFDFASFIGVLEWVGISDIKNDPRECQVLALKNVYKSLKPDGYVVIGIENRIGFNNLLGAIDHSGLRFTSLMPRKLADLYLKLRNPNYRSNKSRASYRTYTYTAKGYKNLLADAGFSEVKIFISHPHYATPRCLIEYDNKEINNFFSTIYQPTSKKDFIFSCLFRTLSIIGLGAVLAPHFIIIGKK